MNGELQQEEEARGLENPNGSNHLPSPSPSPSPSPPAESGSEIKVEEDVECGSIATCRICLQSDGDEDEKLISPCMCKGTQQFVHRSCLDQWRSVKEGFDFSHCTTCKAQFHLRVVEFEENAWRKIKFRLFVARDVFLVFFAVQIVIGIMGGLAYSADRNGSFRNSFNDKWDRFLSKHPIPFYYCVGVLAFFVLLYLLGFLVIILHTCLDNNPVTDLCRDCFDSFPALIEACVNLVAAFVVIFVLLGIVFAFGIATIAFQRSWQRHNHILTKRQLTQEYVVEDLHGCYTPAKLDPQHMERLRTLKLF